MAHFKISTYFPKAHHSYEQIEAHVKGLGMIRHRKIKATNNADVTVLSLFEVPRSRFKLGC